MNCDLLDEQFKEDDIGPAADNHGEDGQDRTHLERIVVNQSRFDYRLTIGRIYSPLRKPQLIRLDTIHLVLCLGLCISRHYSGLQRDLGKRLGLSRIKLSRFFFLLSEFVLSLRHCNHAAHQDHRGRDEEQHPHLRGQRQLQLLSRLQEDWHLATNTNSDPPSLSRITALRSLNLKRGGKTF